MCDAKWLRHFEADVSKQSVRRRNNTAYISRPSTSDAVTGRNVPTELTARPVSSSSTQTPFSPQWGEYFTKTDFSYSDSLGSLKGHRQRCRRQIARTQAKTRQNFLSQNGNSCEMGSLPTRNSLLLVDVESGQSRRSSQSKPRVLARDHAPGFIPPEELGVLDIAMKTGVFGRQRPGAPFMRNVKDGPKTEARLLPPVSQYKVKKAPLPETVQPTRGEHLFLASSSVLKDGENKDPPSSPFSSTPKEPTDCRSEASVDQHQHQHQGLEERAPPLLSEDGSDPFIGMKEEEPSKESRVGAEKKGEEQEGESPFLVPKQKPLPTSFIASSSTSHWSQPPTISKLSLLSVKSNFPESVGEKEARAFVERTATATTPTNSDNDNRGDEKGDDDDPTDLTTDSWMLVPVRSSDTRLQGMLRPFQREHRPMPTNPMAAELKVRREQEAKAEAARGLAAAAEAEAKERRVSRLRKFQRAVATVKLVGGAAAAFKSALEQQQETDLSRSAPRLVTPKAVTDGRDKTYIDWIELRGGELPGPGQYESELARKKLEAPGGGKFNASVTKSDLEWKIHRANETPGVGEYKVPTSPLSGGKFNASRAKSDLEWQIYRAAQTPGPGEYKIPEPRRSSGAFSVSKPKSDLEWQIYRAAQIPGPSEYEVKDPNTKLGGGKFNDSRPPSDIDLAVSRAQQVPGPGEYKLADERRNSGAFSTAFPKSDLEWTIHRAQQIPGPGEYQVQNADAQLFSAGHTGKFSFRLKPTDGPVETFAAAVDAVKVLTKVSNAANLFKSKIKTLSPTNTSAAAAAAAAAAADSSTGKDIAAPGEGEENSEHEELEKRLGFSDALGLISVPVEEQARDVEGAAIGKEKEGTN